MEIDWQYIAYIVIALIVLIILIIFKKPIDGILNKLAQARTFSKTREGFTADFGEEPQEIKDAKSEEQIIVKSDLENSCKENEGETEKENENWLSCLIDKDYSSAIRILESKLETEKDPAEIIKLETWLCHVHFSEDFSEGVKKFKELLIKYPNESYPYSIFALSYTWNNMNDEALKVLDDGLSKKEDDLKLLQDKVDILIKLGRDEDALKLLDNILKKHDAEVSAYLHACESYVKLKKKDIAHSCLKRAYRLNPDGKLTLSAYAEFLYEEGKNEEALILYKKLVDVCPDEAKHFGYLGNIYLNLKLNNKALECYEKANKLADGKESWILGNIGNVLVNQGFYSKGIEYFKEAFKIDPDSEYSHNRMSGALKRKDEEDEKERKIVKENERLI